MSESFIHYLWQYQYFDKSELRTTTGEPVHVFSAGHRNTDSGPDFIQAKIKLAEIQWVGNVEIHVNSSGWVQHKHQDDPAYDNVILHVVWKDDRPVSDRSGHPVPTIELKDRIDPDIISRYRTLFSSVEEIPCAAHLPGLRRIILYSTLDRVLTSRLQNKAAEVEQLLNRNTGDWEETCYQVLAKNFGFKVNSAPFHQLARALPYRLLMKHGDKLHQLEAMLFGVAGFLDEKHELDYYTSLQQEYHVLRRKYRLDPLTMNKAQWKFLRLRPANFPTIRIAQFASFLHYRRNIFSSMLHNSAEKLRDDLDTPPSSFWQTHYNFNHETHGKDAQLGTSSIENIFINTIVPINACYARIKDDDAYMDRALRMLYDLPSEFNAITRKWNSYSVKSRNAFDSQALIELFNNFCSRHRCLECNIGASLIKPG